MGMTVCGVTVVGFVVDSEYLFDRLSVFRDEVSHMEPRFDPKNGKTIDPVKVVDVPCGHDIKIGKKVFSGKDADESWDELRTEEEVLKELSKVLGCEVDIIYTDCDSSVITLTPKSVEHKDGYITMKSVVNVHGDKTCNFIKKACLKLGFDPGPAGIHTVTSCG